MNSIEQDYKYKSKIIGLILLVLFLTGVLFFAYQAKKINQNLEEQISYVDTLINKDFQRKIVQTKQEYIINVDTMLTASGVTEAFANQDREKLFKLTNKFYTKFKSNDKFLKIMTFRLTDGSTFLRVHKPKMYGDKLNKKRKIIIDTNKAKSVMFGFEIGKLKMSYRVVTPIFHNNKHVGLVEVGILPEKFTADLNNLFNIKNALIVKTEDTKISLKQKKHLTANGYSLINTQPLMKNIFNSINPNNNDNINFKYNNLYYIVHTDLNLLNHKSQVTAKILLAQDITAFKDRYNKFITETIFIAFLVFIFLYFILNKSFNQYIKQLSKSKLELEELNKGLEEAVDKKTKELNQLNITLEDRIEDAIHELEEQNKILTEQTKMASLGEMIGNIAHQWRQPLGAISSAASGILLQKELGAPIKSDELDNALGGIVSNTQFLSQTIEDFRNFLSNDKKVTQFKISDAIGKALSIMNSSINNHKLTIVTNYPENELIISSYQNELIQALLNIVANAKEALGEYIQCDNLRLITIDLSEDGDKHIIKVQDNGGGISGEIINKILEPYFTTKHQSQGTGLGLYMTHQIIHDHMQGDINIQNTTFTYEDRSYKGALITISLPMKLRKIDANIQDR